MMMKPPREDTEPWYKQFWPWFIISIPAGTIVAALITINIAVTTSDGLVKDDYYKEGLAIHKDAARTTMAKELGIKESITYQADEGMIHVQLNDAQIGNLTELNINLSHPTRPNFDQAVRLELTGQNRYSGAVDKLPPANWKYSLEPESKTWRVNGRFEVSLD